MGFHENICHLNEKSPTPIKLSPIENERKLQQHHLETECVVVVTGPVPGQEAGLDRCNCQYILSNHSVKGVRAKWDSSTYSIER